MKLLTPKLLAALLPFLGGGCGGGHDHDHSHGGHGHGDHADEATPEEVTLSAAAVKQHDVRDDAVSRRTLLPTISIPARVAFNEETTAHVGTLASGRISEMKVHLGHTVKKGDVLFVIESPELGAAQNAFLQALNAEAAAVPALALARNNAGVVKAEADVKSAEALLAFAVNPAAVNQAEAKLAAARASEALAKNKATIARAQGKLAAATPVEKQARGLVESGKKLAESGAIAMKELRRREAVLQIAVAEVQAAQAAIDQAKAQQERDLRSAEAQLQTAAAEVVQAKAQRKRDTVAAQAKITAASAALKAAGAKKEKELGVATSGLSTARASVATARNKLQLFGMADEDVDKLAKTSRISPQYVVRAPRNGTVVEREVTLGENANSNQPHLLILADLSKVWVLMEVPPANAIGLKAGQSVSHVNKETGYHTETVLEYVSPVVDPETRTVQARVELENTKGQWRPGQFLTVRLPTGKPSTETIAIPAKAVQFVDGQPTVYLPTKKDNTFKMRSIAVGAEVDGWLPVLHGLKVGDKVVINGSFLLKAEFGKAGAGHDHTH